MEQINESTSMITVLPDDIANYDVDAIIVMAERADKLVAALNKMMMAAIKITTAHDWVIIGGKPYLQESGATKVARLFGIGWKILDVQRELDDGYPSFTYRMVFRMGGTEIECDGSRSGRDEFFTGQATLRDGSANPKHKGPDQVDANDVKKAAYTNCLNNGIKRLLPGLRNIDIETLEKGGVNTQKLTGYTFKEGSRGGTGRSAAVTGLTCTACGAAITQAEASYSEGRFGRRLCRKCQRNPPAPTSEPEDDYIPPTEEP